MSKFPRFFRVFGISLLLGAAACSREAPPVTPAQSAANEAKQRRTAAAELLDLGLHFASGGDSVRAEQYLAAALDAGANPNDALLPLLKLCIKASRFEAAAQYAETYAREVTARRDLEMLLGGLYVTLEQSDKAVVHLQRVTVKYPDHPLAHLLLGRLLRDQGRDLEQADLHFRAYLRLQPEGPYATEAQESLLKSLSETEQLPDLSQVDPALSDERSAPHD